MEITVEDTQKGDGVVYFLLQESIAQTAAMQMTSVVNLPDVIIYRFKYFLYNGSILQRW